MGIACQQYLPGGRRPGAAPRSVLVVRRGNLGDTVVALPAFHAIRRRFPDAHLALLTSPTKRGRPTALDVLTYDSTFDDSFLYYDDEPADPAFRSRLQRQVREWGVDLAILLPNTRSGLSNVSKHMALLAIAGVRHVAGAQLLRGDESAMGQAPRLVRMLAPAGIEGVEPFPWIRLSDAERAAATRLTETYAGRKLIGMQCGAKRSANRWPRERFIETGRRLVAEEGAQIFLTGSPGEAGMVTSVAEAIGTGCANLAGRTSVTELAAVAERLDAFVSNDTGTMHVVAAMGAPVVAIFSARDHPHLWYPHGDRHVVLRKNVDCSPCMSDDVCPLFDVPKCLDRIGVEEVMAALRRVLNAD
jgi:ADP-heptose:LPS heptosyltransferase